MLVLWRHWDKISTFRFFVQITNLVCAMDFVTLFLMQRIPWWCNSNLENDVYILETQEVVCEMIFYISSSQQKINI